MKVLYVNHTSQISGAERSLLELIELVRARAEVGLACPPGPLMDEARARGIVTAELDLPELGFSSSLLTALPRLARAGRQLRRLARRPDVDVVHAASPRAGLLAACCILTRPRRVVDVRDVLPPGATATAVRLALRLTADLIVFNSQFTRSRFGSTYPAADAILHPPVDVERLAVLPLPSAETRGAPPVLGVLGQITPWKGQDDAIRILASVRKRIPGTRLRIIGSVVFSGSSVAFDNEAFGRSLPTLADELGVADAVEIGGATDDLVTALGSLDVLLVPSWQEPFGRVVVEAMAAGVPVVATSAGGPSEIIEHGVSGLLAPPRDPESWVEPVSRLLESFELSRQIAESARERLATVLGDASDRSARLQTLYGLSGADRADSEPKEHAPPTPPVSTTHRSRDS